MRTAIQHGRSGGTGLLAAAPPDRHPVDPIWRSPVGCECREIGALMAVERRRAPQRAVWIGIGQYARNRLSAAKEQQFGEEVRGWVDNGWLVEHDPTTHGDVPLLAKVQEHKSTTPVRPCPD